MTVLTQRNAILDPLRLATISLDEMNDIAKLQTRVDRKYIVEQDVISSLAGSLPNATVLEIDGQQSFDYESVYFDTADFDLYKAAAHRRRRRFKVRTRVYQNPAACVLEVKSKGGRGQTIKMRQDYDTRDRRRLTLTGRSFVDGVVGRPGASDGLLPVLTTHYQRTTIVDPSNRSRLTYDQGLTFTDWRGQSIALDDLVVVETKSSGAPSVADRWLWSQGLRPTKISKFCTGLAALHPELPANKWHRTIQTHFPHSGQS